jgi:hypothetical protein
MIRTDDVSRLYANLVWFQTVTADISEEVRMTELVVLVLIVLLALSGYAAGRLHGHIGYRLGYRFGYRHGYFDGDRASWSRRRRELQAALASVLSTPAAQRPVAYPVLRPVGTTYTSPGTSPGQGIDDTGGSGGGASRRQGAGRHSRVDRRLVEAGGDR